MVMNSMEALFDLEIDLRELFGDCRWSTLKVKTKIIVYFERRSHCSQWVSELGLSWIVLRICS